MRHRDDVRILAFESLGDRLDRAPDAVIGSVVMCGHVMPHLAIAMDVMRLRLGRHGEPPPGNSLSLVSTIREFANFAPYN